MAALDKSLQALFKMAHMKPLWQNASPGSGFEAQALTLNGLESCTDICIVSAVAETNVYQKETWFPAKKAGIILDNRYSESDSIWFLVHRGFAFEAPNKLVFDTAYTINLQTGIGYMNNKRNIPLIIYGIANSGS